MRICLTVAIGRREFDWTIHADEHARVHELAATFADAAHICGASDELLGYEEPPVGTVRPPGEHRWAVVDERNQVLPDNLHLHAAGIGMGSRLRLVRAPQRRFEVAVPTAALALVHVDGRRYPLRGARVRIDTISLERRGRTWYVLPGDGTRHQHLHVELPTPIEAGDSITNLGSEYRVESLPTAPTALADPNGTCGVHLSAPEHIGVAVRDVPIAVPPTRVHQQRWPSWSLFGSLAGAGLMYLVWPQWYMVAWMAISSLWMVFSVIEARRHDRADYRDALEIWEHDFRGAVELLTSRRRLEARRRTWETPGVEVLVGRVRTQSPLLWDRVPDAGTDIPLRIGTGSMRSEVRIVPDGEVVEPAIRSRLERVNRLPIDDVPIVADLASGPVGICGPLAARRNLWRAALLQLSTRYPPTCCNITVGGLGEDTGRWIPNCQSIESRSEFSTASSNLVERLRNATAAEATSLKLEVLAIDLAALRIPPAVVMTALRTVVEAGGQLIVLARHRDELPREITTVINLHDPVAHVEQVDSGVRQEIPQLETLDRTRWFEIERRLAPLRDAAASTEQGDLPRHIDFETLRVAQPPALMSSVIGMGAQEPMEVDLRRDGPHALVAGTTGSGKSEFLRTWIAALAVGSTPAQLTFLLIDYKGGAAFRECADLPHTVGLLTDLDETLASRALISLRAEVRRREYCLSQAGVRDLMEWELAGNPAFPALLIVIDEFATLLREIPTFVDGIVDIAQRGRSLGIHLILATQRPSGVVSDSIRANTNIRICLRVTDPDDSIDVIGIPDAAWISSAIPGRAFLRFGQRPASGFQSTYVSGTIRNSQAPRVQVLNLPELEATHDHNENTESELQGLVTEITQRHYESGAHNPRRPWLEPLPSELPFDALAPLLEHAI